MADSTAIRLRGNRLRLSISDRVLAPLRALLPAAAVIVVQLVLYPVPLGVWVQGVVLGALNALLALGLALVYRASRILNFAQADFGTAPAVLAWGLIAMSGVGYVVGFITGLLGALLLGAVVEFLIVRRFFRSPRLILTVATIGLSQLLIVVSLAIPRIWGVDLLNNKSIGVPFHLTFTIQPLVFNANHVLALILAPLCIIAIAVWLRATDVGIAVRAAAERRDRAAMLGIPVRRLSTVVWVIASALSFLTIFLRSAILGLALSPTLSLGVLVSGLAALALGGFADLPAIAAAGVALGVLEQGVTWNNPTKPTLVYAVFAVVVVVGLLVRHVGARRVDRDPAASWEASVDVRPIPIELRRLPSVRFTRWGGLAAALVFAITLPLWLGPADTSKATGVAAFALVALSIVVLTGWTGQVSLGQMSFAAVGGVVGALASAQWGLDMSLSLLVAGAIAAVAAVVVGLPALRLRGIFFAVTTLVFALAATDYLLNRSQFSWIPAERINRPTLFGIWSLGSEPAMFELSLGCLVLALIAIQGIRRSRTGRTLRAGRDNDRAAQSYGVHTMRAKLIAFAMSGFLAGIAGCLLVHLNQAYTEAPFDALPSLAIFTAAVVGGVGSAGGAIIGALLLSAGQWWLPVRWQLLPSALGVLFILMVLPGGLGELIFRGRDMALRLMANRRGIVVPSLVADVRVEDESNAPAGQPPDITSIEQRAATAEAPAGDEPREREVTR